MRSYTKRVSQKASKLSTEQLSALIDEMFEENENLYSILESLSAGLMILDNNFILQQTNTILESRITFKTSPEDKNIPVWELIEDDEIAVYLKKCFDKQITNSSDDFTVMTPGGAVRFLTIAMTPLIRNSELRGRIIIVRDITESKNQEVLLHRMENLAKLTNLAAGMAHEIKNPLGAISIHIQLVQKALDKARNNNDILPGKKFVEDHIDVVNDEIEHLNKLVMDFLMAVRPVKATLELKNPGKILTNLMDFINPEFKKENISVNLSVPEKDTRIMLDEKLFREMILNLAQNSLAAIKSNTLLENSEGKFGIECAFSENKYLIRILDNGCGMSAETLSKIFEPYYTTKANGTGLGMTMVYKIVKEFSGDIQVESEEGKGTVFTLIFPIPQKDKKLLSHKD